MIFTIVTPNLLSYQLKIVISVSRIAKNLPVSNTPFNPFFDILNWIKNGKINYLSNVFVEKLISTDSGKVTVCYQSSAGLKNSDFDRVFLGAGCVNTTSIVHKSLYAHKKCNYRVSSAPILLQLYLNMFPNKNYIRQHGIARHCFAFLERKHNNNPPYWSHTQLSQMNSSIYKKIISLLPSFLHPLVRYLSRYLVFSITVFHSDMGPKLKFTVLILMIQGCRRI